MTTLTFKDFIDHLAAWHRHSLLPPRLARIIALAAGAMMPFAFAPFSFALLAIISVAAILFVWQHTPKPRDAFVCGWLFGLTYFGIGTSWIYVSLHRYGNMPFFLAALTTLIFVCTLALFPAINGYCWRRLYPRGKWRSLLLAFPSLWVFCEWSRTWVLGGFPWLFIGNSQIDSPLSNIAPIFGVYGASFLVAFVAAVSIGIPRAKTTFMRLALALTLALTWIGCDLLENINWTKPFGSPLSVSVVQGNIPQELKWQDKKINYILQTYEDLTKDHWQNDIIVWPEAAIPVLQTQAVQFLEKLDRQAEHAKNTLITGIPFVYVHQGNPLLYNAIITLGHKETQYFKRHLVPFGEYKPLKPWLDWIWNFLKIPMSDFSSGASNQPALHADDITIAPFVCYEIAYPELALDFMPHANLLLTVSDDSWFGHSLAAAQQFEIARMRSLETGRYQIVATNTGVTGIINPQGLVVARAPISQRFVLNTTVQPMQGATPWVAFGHHLWILLLAVCLVVGGPRASQSSEER